MNFLAHIYLSGEEKEIQFGGFIADFIKGNKYKVFSEKIIQGILLHRSIDSYTDTHQVVKRSNEKFRAVYGKYAGIATDILYDHFLAADWKQFSDVELEKFVKDFHKTVKENINLIPESSYRFVNPFIEKNRLLCYRTIDCLQDVFDKMAFYTSMPDKTNEAMKIIETNYSELKTDFKTFFTDVKTFSFQELVKNKNL